MRERAISFFKIGMSYWSRCDVHFGVEVELVVHREGEGEGVLYNIHEIDHGFNVSGILLLTGRWGFLEPRREIGRIFSHA